MKKVFYEFHSAELIAFAIMILMSIVFNVWIFTSVAVYLILRKIDGYGFKVLRYLAPSLILIAGAKWIVRNKVYSIILDSNDFTWPRVSYQFDNVFSVFYMLPVVAFGLIVIVYLKKVDTNKLISFTFITALLGVSLEMVAYIGALLFRSAFGNLTTIQQAYTISNLTPFLLGAVLFILYKDIFGYGESKEIYEVYEETI